MLATFESFPTAYITGNIHLSARFSKREETSTESILKMMAIELLCKEDESSFKFGESYIGIDNQTFNLMEHAITSCTNCFAAINPTRHNCPYRRFIIFHYPNLYWRSMGS